MIIHGIEIEPKEIVCHNCGVVDFPAYKWIDSNRTIQIRCKSCGRWNGNYPYGTFENYIMPFGKHKGELVCELPYNYLGWLYENAELKGGLLAAVETALENEEKKRGLC